MSVTNRDENSPAHGAAPIVALETLRFLVGALGAGDIWRWLGERDRAALRSEVTKGFKSAPGTLRHGVAQARLARHLERHEQDFQSLLALWAATQSELLREIRNHLPQGAPDDTTQVLAPDTAITEAQTQIPEDETAPPGAKNAGEVFDAVTETASPTLVITNESLAPLRARYGEHALQLALLYIGHAAPDENTETPQTDTIQKDSSQEAVDDSAHYARNEETRALWQRRLQEAKAARDTHRHRASALATELETLKTRHQREMHELRAQLVKSQKEANTQREKAVAAQKNMERETRRARQSIAQHETIEAENKRLKRRLRQLQEGVEDARKTAATTTTQLQRAHETIEVLQTELEAVKSAAQHASSLPASTRAARKPVSTPVPRAQRVPVAPIKVAPLPPRVLDPLDEVFRWNVDSHDFAITLREASDSITRNDEARVFALSRALESLRESNEKTYLNFLARVREFGPYFRRVLTVLTTRVLVDASNVARIETDRRGRGKLDFLLQAREELRRRDAFPLLLIADASLQHYIDEPNEIAAMARRGELILLPAGNVADDFLAREARRTGAFVLTNDKSFHKQVAPDFEPSRIGFKLRHNFIEIDDF